MRSRRISHLSGVLLVGALFAGLVFPRALSAEPKEESPEWDQSAGQEVETDSEELPSEKKARGPGKWAVTLAGFTDIPLQVGAVAQIDPPGALRLRGGIGYLPGGYVKAANGILVGAFKGYTEEDAELVESTVTDSLLWQVSAGLVTGQNQGFYLQGGYAVATFAGTAASGDLIEQSSGREIPARAKNRYDSRDFDVGSTLHQADVEMGFEAKFSQFSFQIGLGWAFTIASSATVEAQFGDDVPVLRDALDEVERDAEKDLKETYRKYVHPPYLSVGFGLVFR